jgi:hypothetical protein
VDAGLKQIPAHFKMQTAWRRHHGRINPAQNFPVMGQGLGATQGGQTLPLRGQGIDHRDQLDIRPGGQLLRMKRAQSACADDSHP